MDFGCQSCSWLDTNVFLDVLPLFFLVVRSLRLFLEFVIHSSKRSFKFCLYYRPFPLIWNMFCQFLSISLRIVRILFPQFLYDLHLSSDFPWLTPMKKSGDCHYSEEFRLCLFLGLYRVFFIPRRQPRNYPSVKLPHKAPLIVGRYETCARIISLDSKPWNTSILVSCKITV